MNIDQDPCADTSSSISPFFFAAMSHSQQVHLIERQAPKVGLSQPQLDAGKAPELPPVNEAV